MASKKIIDCIGASDEDDAHLRLLLRTAASQLRDTWQWGSEEKADLVIVDARSLSGGGALRRTLQRGVACAQIIETDMEEPKGRFLRKPLQREPFVALLNGIGSKGIAPMAVLSQGADFFLVDLGEFDDEPSEVRVDTTHIHKGESAELDAFESLFKRDPMADKSQILMPEQFDHAASVEYTGDGTERSQTRADSYGNAFAREEFVAASIDPGYRREKDAGGDALHSLRDYLTGRLLGGPARINLPDAPALVLDPKEQVFHSSGGLAALSPYCRQPLRLDAWHKLVSSELNDLRDKLPARPYLQLLWLDHYLNSGGRLAPHLDPGGRFRLTKRLMGLVPDFANAARIGSLMLQPKRLNEIAKESDIDLVEVFNVVNAYEAIGYLEWTHRERPQR
ncbi:MAG: hypothetical protein ABI365_09000 [Lysobacteraceae bacterium]